MFSLPFSLSDVYGGFANAHGTIRFDGTLISLEFEIQDGIFGIVKSGVREVQIPVAEIAAIAFKKKAFRTTIALRCHSLKSAERIPGQKGGEFKIQIKRSYRDEAEQFASVLRLAVSEARLTAIQERKE